MLAPLLLLVSGCDCGGGQLSAVGIVWSVGIRRCGARRVAEMRKRIFMPELAKSRRAEKKMLS